MVTIRMIAKKCGCSTATVSKALNGAPDVSAETAERILAAAAEMGYTPNAAARALKTSRSYSFGVLFEESSNIGLAHEFFARILNGFKCRAEELGYDISFISDRLGGRDIRYADHARYRNYDGVLVANVDANDTGVLELLNSGIPIVTIDYVFDHCGSVMSDNVSGIRDLVNHVYQKGHRKIAMIHGDLNAVSKIRIASFLRTCKELGLEVPEEYIVSGFFRDPPSASLATRKLLSLPDPPTCIFYPDDYAYIGGMNEIERSGLSIPEDISAVGYDGLELIQAFRPRLTTLRQEALEMGTAAAEELVRAVEEGKAYIPRSISVPGHVLAGDTVKDLNQ